MVSKKIKSIVGQKINYKIIKDGFKTENGTIDVTSDMDTNILLETPSEPYISNIDYSIVEKENCAPILKLNQDLILPDDSVLEKNNYLIYPKGKYLVVDDELTGDTGTTYENNFSICGDVKNFGSVFSNFNFVSYITLPKPFKPGDKSWEIVFKIIPSTVNSMQRLIGQIGGFYATIGGEIQSNGTLGFGVTSTNSTWNIAWLSGTTVLNPNTLYWIRLSFTGTEYKFELSTDGKEYNLENSVVNSTPIYQGDDSIINLGYHGNNSTYRYLGSIDLDGTYIKIGDEYWWKPQINNMLENFIKSGSPTITNGIVNNFSSSNYITLDNSFVSKNATYVFKVTFPSSMSSSQCIFEQDYFANMEFRGNTQDLRAWNWQNSQYEKIMDITFGKTYWFKMVINDSVKTYSYSEDGQDYIEAYVMNDNATNTTTSNFFIGVTSRRGNIFQGSIDLKESYIKINDELVWEGFKKNKFKKGNFKINGSPIINENGVISNFSDSNYIQFLYVVNNETEIFTKFTTGSDISNMPNLITIVNSSNQGGGEIYINNNAFQTWNMASSTDVTLANALPNTSYQAKMKLNPSGRTITIYDAEGNVITEHTENDSGATFTNTSIINFGFLNPNNTSRHWKGSIDLANTYVIIDGVKYNLLENAGVYLQGIFDESFVDNYNQEQVVKLYHTMSKDNGLTITNDKVNDENVLYSQYIDNITIPSRSKQFNYNIDDEVWEEI